VAEIISTPKQQSIKGHVSASISALHIKRKFSEAPMVASEVRRNDRLKGKSQGYK
jgi:hypothetical protein